MDNFKREVKEFAARCKKTCGYCPGQTKPKPVVCGTPIRFGDGMCNDENNTPECKKYLNITNFCNLRSN